MFNCKWKECHVKCVYVSVNKKEITTGRNVECVRGKDRRTVFHLMIWCFFGGYACVCVCMCVRERECVCVCVRERVCVWVREREKEIESVCVCDKERDWERKRERECSTSWCSECKVDDMVHLRNANWGLNRRCLC